MAQKLIYAIGDVHGRADLLSAILDFAQDDADKNGAVPAFVFLGDIVDKGGRSRECLEMVMDAMQKAPSSTLILGNHDDLFLKSVIGENDQRRVAAWLARGGFATLESYLRGDPEGAFELIETLHSSHVDLLQRAVYSKRVGPFVFAHAGINPMQPLSSQTSRDLMWIRDPFMDHIGHLGAAIIHGHSVVGDRPVVTENRISIDTGAYASGRLTTAVIDLDMGNVRFAQTNGDARNIVEVAPVLCDRGLGTLLSNTGVLSGCSNNLAEAA